MNSKGLRPIILELENTCDFPQKVSIFRKENIPNGVNINSLLPSITMEDIKDLLKKEYFMSNICLYKTDGVFDKDDIFKIENECFDITGSTSKSAYFLRLSGDQFQLDIINHEVTMGCSIDNTTTLYFELPANSKYNLYLYVCDLDKSCANFDKKEVEDILLFLETNKISIALKSAEGNLDIKKRISSIIRSLIGLNWKDSIEILDECVRIIGQIAERTPLSIDLLDDVAVDSPVVTAETKMEYFKELTIAVNNSSSESQKVILFDAANSIYENDWVEGWKKLANGVNIYSLSSSSTYLQFLSLALSGILSQTIDGFSTKGFTPVFLNIDECSNYTIEHQKSDNCIDANFVIDGTTKVAATLEPHETIFIRLKFKIAK